ncbi:hypothetical protein AYO47_07570 [Planctomyces sp. SCGC AG-212-M04]|nr:hypothetical protein AYO47_07570 [Planctomyces sp. SCGC AG-212-M04]
MRSQRQSRTGRVIFFCGVLSVVQWALAPRACCAQTKPGVRESFVIRRVRVFDGRQVLPESDVWVAEDKIKSVARRLTVPEGVAEVDGEGNTLLPGFIDSHTHTSGDALKTALVFGVTTELDMFTDIAYVRHVKQEQSQGKGLDMADIRSAGTLATAAKGHGTQFGIVIPTIAAPAEAGPWVQERVQEGSDYIKIVYDDGSIYGTPTPTLSKETMKAVIDAAHEHHKLAVVHIGSQQQARDALEAGADGLVHLFTDSAPTADFTALVSRHHAFIVPTLTILEGLSGTPGGESLIKDARLMKFLSPAEMTGLKQAFPKKFTRLREEYAEQTVRQLIAADVPVLAGSDAPNPGTSHGASIHRELELLVRSGMTPTQALAAATSVPAAAFQLEDRGKIASGKRADLLMVEGDPTTDITATRAIVSVWKAGVLLDRDAYAEKVANEKLEATKKKSHPIPPGAQAGLISDFESGKPSAAFGNGWSVTDDSIAGGSSSAEMTVVENSANDGKHALKVTGKIAGFLPFAWSGVMFTPGERMFAPVNLSEKKALSFLAKGDGKTYRVMIFTETGGRIPSQQTFVAGKEWKQYEFSFSAFNGTDGHDLSAIVFVGGPAAGSFDFQIDDVRLK